MVVKFDAPSKTSSGVMNNTGSSAAFVGYLDKEDKLLQEQGQEPQEWFNHERSHVSKGEVRVTIDSDHQGIGREAGKFSTGSISPTPEEWQALGNTEAERLQNFKAWVQEDFSKEFADNFQKFDKAGNAVKIEPENVKMFYKIEFDRQYKGTDEAVKAGLKKQGEIKEGFNVHCHFISATKTADGKSRISPTTNNRKEFSRDSLTQKVETSFDLRTKFDRPMKQRYDYAKTMKNGTGLEKAQLLQKSAAQQVATAKKVVAHEVKKELSQQVAKVVVRKAMTGGLSL